ncbi:MAG: NapC/NirT family cytochrome c [Verrucomicrobiae bacterium]|nr:NapC/NirT family cytochrome c [Verrucomicrobiae bacterium]
MSDKLIPEKSPEAPPKKRPGKLASFNNWISFSGVVIATGSLFAFMLLFAIDAMTGHSNPYMGILTYLGSPMFLTIGLFLMVLGWFIHRRHLKSQARASILTVSMDLSSPRDRRNLLIFSVSAILFMLLTALGSYQTYHYTESVQFCGQVCHEVMEPEYTTYLQSPHARVACVECHIGSGVNWYVKAKISGLRQVYAVLTNDFDRPVDTPIANLRPAQDTCEQCHWPQKFTGNLDRTYVHYLIDEENTPFFVRMLLKVGGGDPRHGPVDGIHWHTNKENKVEYVAVDDDRQEIPWVRMTDKDGKVTVYKLEDYELDAAAEIRTMDCMDCHNRPAHVYTTPNDYVDQSIFMGRLSRELVDVKFNTVDLLTAEYENREEAQKAIEEGMTDYYEDEESLPQVIAEVKRIYSQSFFPEMKASWKDYPENIGHKDWPGCFRCHDGKHVSSDTGAAISITASDCNSCHTIIAQGEELEARVLDSRGLEFAHPDGEWDEELLCSDCHNGALQ